MAHPVGSQVCVALITPRLHDIASAERVKSVLHSKEHDWPDESPLVEHEPSEPPYGASTAQDEGTHDCSEGTPVVQFVSDPCSV